MKRRAIAYFDPRSNQGVGGSVMFQQQPNDPKGVIVHVRLFGFGSHGTHAFHIHEFGDLSQGCQSTGKHFNPSNQPHGSLYYGDLRHVGDLINNLSSDEKGHVDLVFRDPLLSLDPRHDHCIVGRSIVIHYYADDYGLEGQLCGSQFQSYEMMPTAELRTMAVQRGYMKTGERGITRKWLVQKFVQESKTTGNAGQRLACAVIGWTSA